MKLTGIPGVISDQDPLSFAVKDSGGTNYVQQETPGQLSWDAIGRKYRYFKNGAVAAVVGTLMQSPAYDTQFVDMAVQAAVPLLTSGVGGPQTNNKVPVTLGSTSTTAGMFALGSMVVSVGAAMLGTTYQILSHDVATNATTCNFYTAEPIQIALTTSAKVTVTKNDYIATVINPTTRTGKIVGVAQANVPISSYGWLAVEGKFGVLCDVTVPTSIGNGASPSTTTAGCVTKGVTLIDRIGTFYILGVSAQVEPVDLRIP